MSLNAEVQHVINEYKKLNLPKLSSLSPEQAREELMKYYDSNADLKIPLEKITGLNIPGPQSDIAIRIYWPDKKPNMPALLYFAGGGFVVGNLNTSDVHCQQLTYLTGCVIISVNYARSPEHPFPAPVEDGYAVLQWVHSNANKLSIDPDNIGVLGENSGGTIAASLCLMARDREGPAINYQVLIYPMLDNRLETESSQKFADGYLLTRDSLQWYWGHYLSNPNDADNPYAVPAKEKDFSFLPPAQIVSGEFDPLRDEVKAYADKLKEAGIPVEYHCYKGLVSGFLNLFGVVAKVDLAFSDITDKIKTFMSPEEPEPQKPKKQ